MKSMIALSSRCVMAMSTPVLIDAANINASDMPYAYRTYNGMKLNEGVTIYANAPRLCSPAQVKPILKTALMQAGCQPCREYAAT